MQKNIYDQTLNLIGWKQKKREPQSGKISTLKVLGYMKDEIMATVEGCKKKFSEKWIFSTRT